MEQNMKKRTWVIIFLVIVLCISLNLIRQQDTSAMGIARDLFLQTRAQIDAEELGQAKGQVAEGRRSMLAYRAAHTELSKNGYYKGLSADHLPLLEVLIENLEIDGYVSTTGYTFDDKKTDVMRKFDIDSRKVEDNWQ